MYNIKLVKVNSSVELLSHNNPVETIVKGWNISRPKLSIGEINKNINEIFKLDLPVIELAQLTLHFKTSLAFRDLYLLIMRQDPCWATSSRVNRLDKEWKISNFVSNISQIESYIKETEDAILKGVSQDIFRSNLPLCFITEFTTTSSIRDLSKFMNFLYNYSKEHKTDLGKECAIVMGNLLKIFNELKIPRSIEKLRAFIEPDEFKYESSEDMYVKDSEEFLSLYIKEVPFNLHAQFIRHRAGRLKTNYFNIISDNEVYTKRMKDINFSVCLTCDKDEWLNIIIERSCYLSQGDIWFEIINKVSDYIDKSKIKLPCQINNKCPYEQDCIKRLEFNDDGSKKDPGIPCPAHILINRYNVDILNKLKSYKNYSEYISECEKYIDTTNRNKTIWNLIITQLKKYICNDL